MDQYGVFLHVYECDNQIQVFVNENNEYDRYVDDDPHLDDLVLLQHVVAGGNKVRVICINGPTAHGQYNQCTFGYSITLRKHENGNPTSPILYTYAKEFMTSSGLDHTLSILPGVKSDKTYEFLF
jgi:hypothetical protein